MLNISRSTIYPPVKIVAYVSAIITVGLIPLWLHFGGDVHDIDFISQQIPFILETKRMLSTWQPWWSWNTYAGDNFIAAYSFYTITSPFVWLCCCFSAGNVLWAILLALYIKTICTAYFAFLYFRKMHLPDQLCVLGGLLYAFSSYYICNLFYFHFCEPLMLFPLLLIALEKIIRDEPRCCFWLAIATFAVIFINFYFAVSTLILGLIYFIARLLAEKRLTVSVVCRAFGSVGVGIMTASVVLLPVILHHSGASRAHVSLSVGTLLGYEFGNIGGMLAQILPMLRALIMVKTSEGAHAFNVSNDDIRSTECFLPVFGVMFAAIYVWRRRKDWLSILIVVLIVMYLTPLNGIFTLYSTPYYTRWLYGLSLLLILATLRVMNNGAPVRRKAYALYLGTCTALLGLSVACDMIDAHSNGIDILDFNSLKIFEIAAFVINMILLGGWCMSARCRRYALLMVSVSAALHLSGFTYFNFGTSDPKVIVCNKSDMSNMWGAARPYSSASRPAEMHYRTDHVTCLRNFSMVYDKPGLYCFNSSMNVKLTGLKRFILGNLYVPSLTNTKSRESVAALLSIRDVYYSPDSIGADTGYKYGLSLRNSDSRYVLYTFDHYIPMGFTYDNYITESEFMAYRREHPEVDEPLLMLDNLVIRDEDAMAVKRLLLHGTLDGMVALDSVTSCRRSRVVSDFIGDTRGYSCTTDFDTDEMVFFSIVNDPGFEVRIDGGPVNTYEVNFGFTGIVVPAGRHFIEATYHTPGLKAGAWISFAGLILLVVMWIRGGGAGRGAASRGRRR